MRRLSVARTGPWWCLLAALAVALLGGSLPPFVLPGVPVVLRGVHLVVVLLAAAACWALAGGFARARAGAGTPGGGAEGRPGPGRTGAVRVAWGLFAGLMALGIAGFHEFGTTSTMLTPRSPSGCAVLATEHSFLMAAVVDTARDQGAGVLQAWAVQGEESRARFLDSCGFAPMGMRREAQLGERRLVEICWQAAI